MKTSMYSTLSSLATLMATALFLSAACPSLADDPPKNENNPDKICKYKKKCPSCDGNGPCDDSKPEDDIKTKTVGHDEECPDPVSAGFGKDYELVGGGTRSSNSVRTPVTIRSGFGSDFINLKNLNVYGQGAEIIRDRDTNVRQIKTDTGFLDVISMPETKTIELRQYKPEDIGANKVNGAYSVKDDRIPLVVLRYVQEADNAIRVDTIDNASEFPSVKSERTVQTVGPKPYTITQQKTYLKGEGLSAVEYRRVSKTITGIPGGQPKEEQYFYTTEDLGTDGTWHVIESKTGRRAEYKQEDGLVTLYECDAANEDGTPMNPIATETNYTYYTDPLQTKSYGKMRTLRRNNGYWENKYYDENANAGIEVEKTESPWLNTTAHEPGEAPAGKIRVREEVRCSTDSGVESLTETVDGIAIAKEWTEKSQVNQQMVGEIRHQPHSGGDKVTTTVRYRKAKDVPSHLTGKTVSVHNADGSMILYSYALNGQDLTITQDTGYGEGDSVSHGTRMISTQDKDSGNLKEEVRYALEGGQAYWLGSRTGVNFDNKGVALKWVYNNDSNDYTEQKKDCCHVTWERGRDGITTIYTYDAAGRQTSATSRGITYTIEYSGPTTIQWKQAEGSSQRYLVDETKKNLVQQTVEKKSPIVGGKTLTTQFRFDVTSRTYTTTKPYGTTVSRISTADGQVLSETGTTGLTTTYTYTFTAQHGGGLIVAATDGNRSQTETMDLLGNTVSKQSGNNALTQHSYDVAGRIIKTTLPDEETQLYDYENDVQISGLDLNSDGILNPLHDRMSKIKRVFDSSWPEGKGSWKTEQVSTLNGNWVVTRTQYKTEDETLMKTHYLGVNDYSFEEYPSPSKQADNFIVKTINHDGVITENKYTLIDGLVTQVDVVKKDKKNIVLSTDVSSYDIWGNLVTRSNARSGLIKYSYDESVGELVSVVLPDSSIVSYQYDEYGRRISMSLPDNSHQYISYDSEDRVIREWGSGHYPVSFKYNAYGQKISMTTYRLPVTENASWPEEDESETTWTYEAQTGNLLKKNYADGKVESYSYTSGGKVKTLTNGRNNIIFYHYDKAGQYVRKSVNDNGRTPDQIFFYDQWGRITKCTTEGVVSYEYSYDASGFFVGEVINISTPNGIFSRTINRCYDFNGRLLKYQLKHGNHNEQEISYIYNNAGLLKTITDDGREFSYDYMEGAPHLLEKLTSPVHTTVNVWDIRKGDLVSKTNSWKKKEKNNIISCYTYRKDRLGKRVSMTTSGEAFGGFSAEWQWKYDALGQIIAENEDVYSYDQIGNRLSHQKKDNTLISYQSNEINQYVNIGNSISPIYDSDGNLLSGLVPTVFEYDRNDVNFIYDANNRPVLIKKNDQIEEERAYDSQGRRIRKGNIITLYDGYNAIAEYDLNTHGLKSSYTWGLDLSNTTQGAGGVGGLLSMVQHDRQIPLISYPCYDGNGNITEYLTGENTGTLTAHYEYDAFGNMLKQTGNLYKYRFSTKPYDSIAGLYYYNYRDYDPMTGRWLTRDPIEEEGGINMYAFVSNSSISTIDILGLAGNVTHGTKACKGEDPCSVLAQKTAAWIANYNERYKELMNDSNKHNFKNTNPKKYNTHIEELKKSEDHVKKCSKMLMEKIKNNECCPPDDKNPEVPEFVPFPAPEPAPVPAPIPTRPNPDPSTGSDEGITGEDIGKGVVVGAAGVGLGYALYRAARMIPSLAIPFLWPTIVPNLAIP